MVRWTWKRYYSIGLLVLACTFLLTLWLIYLFREVFGMTDKLSYFLSSLGSLFVAKPILEKLPEPSDHVRGGKLTSSRQGFFPRPTSDPWAIQFGGYWVSFKDAENSFVLIG